MSKNNTNEIEENIFALCAGFIDHLKPIRGPPRGLWTIG
jgi:hypothetical protein